MPAQKTNKWIEHFKDPLAFTTQFGQIISDDEYIDTYRTLENTIYESLKSFLKFRHALKNETQKIHFKAEDLLEIGETQEEDHYTWHYGIPVTHVIEFRLTAGNPVEKYSLLEPNSTDAIPFEIDLMSEVDFEGAFRCERTKQLGYAKVSHLFEHAGTFYEIPVINKIHTSFKKQDQQIELLKVLQQHFFKNRIQILNRFGYMTGLDTDFKYWISTKYH